MKMTGKFEVSISARRDGTPLLKLEALDKEARKTLTKVNHDLEIVWLLAVANGKADTNNVCGSMSNMKETISLTIPLALGGVELFVPRKKKA